MRLKTVWLDLLPGNRLHRPSLQGSVYWMAPEVVKQVAYTKKADVWSVGCLIVEMLTGEHPWAQLNQMQAIFKVSRTLTPFFPLVADILPRLAPPVRSRPSPLTYRLTLKLSWTCASSSIMKFGHLQETS
jgi:serine/threonine protein kinase